MKEGWELKEIKNIGNLFSGNSINKKVKEEKYLNIKEGIPYIATKDVGYDSKIEYNNGVRIPDSDLEKFRVAPKNTIIICAEGGSAGRKIGLINQQVCLVNKLFALSTKEHIEPKFVYYYYQSPSFQNDFKSNLTGLIGGVSKTKFKSIKIPIPLLSEQKQIVSILDQAFNAIDQVKANIEKNIENAQELFQSKLNQIFSQKGEGWEEKKMDEVCEIKSKLINPQESKYQNLLHVGGGNIVAESGELIDLKTAKEEGLKSGKFTFDKNVILYNKIRPYLIKVARPDFIGICSADMYPLTPIQKEITRDFLYFLLISKRFTDYAIAGSARAGMPKVNRKHLFEYTFSLPLIKNQELIIRDLDDIRTKIQTLELEYYNKLTCLEDLKKSILQKAFAGELTHKTVEV